MQESDLLTVAETAAALRFQPSTVRAWILHRKLPYCKLGRRVFIRRRDVEILIASSIVPAQPREGRALMRDPGDEHESS
jgi:excisionase family DNA binding protein